MSWANYGWARGQERVLCKKEQATNEAQKTGMDQTWRTNYVNMHSNSSVLVLLDFNKVKMFAALFLQET